LAKIVKTNNMIIIAYPNWLHIVYKFRTKVQWAKVKSELKFSGFLEFFPNLSLQNLD